MAQPESRQVQTGSSDASAPHSGRERTRHKTKRTGLDSRAVQTAAYGLKVLCSPRCLLLPSSACSSTHLGVETKLGGVDCGGRTAIVNELPACSDDLLFVVNALRPASKAHPRRVAAQPDAVGSSAPAELMLERILSVSTVVARSQAMNSCLAAREGDERMECEACGGDQA